VEFDGQASAEEEGVDYYLNFNEHSSCRPHYERVENVSLYFIAQEHLKLDYLWFQKNFEISGLFSNY
jgi:hypothetical protein